MNEICRNMATHAMMIAVYTDEVRDDNVLHSDEKDTNTYLSTMVALFEFWLND